MRHVDGDPRHVLAHDVEHGIAGGGIKIVRAVERAGSGEQTQMIGAARQQPVEHHLVEALRRSQSIGNPLQRILVEIETGRAEGQIEIGDHHVALERRGDGEGGVVADGARAGAAFSADKGNDLTHRPRLRIGVDGRNALDDLHHLDRGHDIFADAAAQELAIEQHVVDMADGNDLGAGIADLGETVEFAQHVRAVEQGFDDDQVGRRRVAIEGDRRLDPAHLHRNVRLGQAPVLRRLLNHRGRVLVLAKGLDVDARNGPARGASAEASCARSKACSLSAVELSEYAASPITALPRSGSTSLALACSEGAAFGDGRLDPFDVFAPHHVAAFAWTRRLAARTEQVPWIGDRSGKIALGRAAHVGPRHVLRIAADILRPVRAIGRLGDELEIRQPHGRRRIAIAEIRLERDRARDRCRRCATPCAPGRKRAWPPSRWGRPTAP